MNTLPKYFTFLLGHPVCTGATSMRKAARALLWHHNRCSAEVKNRVEPYLHYRSLSSWPAKWWILLSTFYPLKLLMKMEVCKMQLTVQFWFENPRTFWCRIHLWFRWMGGLQKKSMTSQHYRAEPMTSQRANTRWWICVPMATLWQKQEGGYMLLWKRYGNKNI